MKTLLYSCEDNIATIAFHRPKAMNAFDHEMADELLEITHQVANDSKVRAVLLKGEGQLFMAGGDIQFFYRGLDTMPEGVIKIIRALNQSILHLTRMPKPVLASVHGSVAGVGVSLMLACDLVIAAEKTKFTMAYSGLGISPDGGASYHLPRAVGLKKSMEWLLLSDVFDAKEAKEQGLINWLVPEHALAEETQRLLTRLASGPTASYAHIKRLLHTGLFRSLEEQLEQEGFAFEAQTMTADFRAGVTGFLQKSKPVFIGK